MKITIYQITVVRIGIVGPVSNRNVVDSWHISRNERTNTFAEQKTFIEREHLVR